MANFRNKLNKHVTLLLAVFLSCLFVVGTTQPSYAFDLSQWGNTASDLDLTEIDDENIGVDKWVSSKDNTLDEANEAANRNTTYCYLYYEDVQADSYNIGRYKTEISIKNGGYYTEMKNEDYIMDSSGNKLYAWALKECVTGFDMPVGNSIHTRPNTIYSQNFYKPFDYWDYNGHTGTLMFLHRTPSTMTVFEPSRYKWLYNPNEGYVIPNGFANGSVSQYDRTVPSLEGLPWGSNLYSDLEAQLVNYNISYLANTFSMTYSTAPHVLGVEGTEDFLSEDAHFYTEEKQGESSTSYYALAMMDETNGEPVPVLLGTNSSLTPFWSFQGTNLPSKQDSYLQADIGYNKDNYWLFQVGMKDSVSGKELQPFVKLEDIIDSDNNIRNGLNLDLSNRFVFQGYKDTRNQDDMYNAVQHGFVLPVKSDVLGAQNIGLGYRSSLEEAIRQMKYPFLVSSISLAMDETITQRNSSVNFMTSFVPNNRSNYKMESSITDWGQIHTGYGKNRDLFMGFYTNIKEKYRLNFNETAFLFESGKDEFKGKNIVMTFVNDDDGNKNLTVWTPKVYNNALPGNHDGGLNHFSFKTTGLTIKRGLGSKMAEMGWNSDSKTIGDTRYVRMPSKVFSSAIVTQPAVTYYYDPTCTADDDTCTSCIVDPMSTTGACKVDENGNVMYKRATIAFKNIYRSESAVPNASKYVYGFHSFYSLGRYDSDYNSNDGVADMDTLSIEATQGLAHDKAAWSWDKNDDFGTWRWDGVTPSGLGYMATFPYDTEQYSPYAGLYEEDAGNRSIIYPWKVDRGINDGYKGSKFKSGYLYNKVYLEIIYSKIKGIPLDGFYFYKHHVTSPKDINSSDTVRDIYNSMLDTFDTYVLNDISSLIRMRDYMDRADVFKTSYDDGFYKTSNLQFATDTGYENLFIQRAYHLGNTSDNVWKAFEKEYCKALTTEILNDENQLKSGWKKAFDSKIGLIQYDGKCDSLAYPITGGDNGNSISWARTGYYHDSYLALNSAWNKVIPAELFGRVSDSNWDLTYKEFLAYNFYMFYAVDQFATDMSWGRMTGYRGWKPSGTSVVFYHNLTAVSGEFSNIYLLNEETRLNDKLTYGIDDDGTQRYFTDVLTNTLAIDTEGGSPTDGVDVLVPESRDKDNSAFSDTAFVNRFGPELFLIDEASQGYATGEQVEATCEPGYVQEGNTCVLIFTATRNPICPNGYRYEEDKKLCTRVDTINLICPDDYSLYNGFCIRYSGTDEICEDTDVYDDDLGACVNTKDGKCQPGWEPDVENGECVYEKPKSCPFGGELIGDECVVRSEDFTGVFASQANQNFEYVGYMESTVLPAGRYLLEAWGASGGGANGGHGGYSAGVLELDSETTVYINVGQAGSLTEKEVLTWDFSTDLNGWTNAARVSPSIDETEQAMLYQVTDTRDPMLYSPSNMSWEASSSDVIEITYKSDRKLSGQLYYVSPSGPLSESNRFSLNFPATGGAYQTVRFYPTTLSTTTKTWNGNISRLRLDIDGTNLEPVYIKKIEIINDSMDSSFNGGGAASNALAVEAVGSGGGASDIRIGGTTLNDRILVAGGGGGSLSYNGVVYPGGYGGGSTGGDGIAVNSGYSFIDDYVGNGGTRGNGGTNKGDVRNGAFGIGGSGTSSMAGGGGGWYGGSAGNGAGGGSGFVYSLESFVPSGYGVNEKYLLTETTLDDGQTIFLSPEGVSEEGHVGHGYVKITSFDSAEYTCDYINLNENETVSVEDVYVGERFNFNYTGECEMWYAPVAGTYMLETWGASNNASEVSPLSDTYPNIQYWDGVTMSGTKISIPPSEHKAIAFKGLLTNGNTYTVQFTASSTVEGDVLNLDAYPDDLPQKQFFLTTTPTTYTWTFEVPTNKSAVESFRIFSSYNPTSGTMTIDNVMVFESNTALAGKGGFSAGTIELEQGEGLRVCVSKKDSGRNTFIESFEEDGLENLVVAKSGTIGSVSSILTDAYAFGPTTNFKTTNSSYSSLTRYYETGHEGNGYARITLLGAVDFGGNRLSASVGGTYAGNNVGKFVNAESAKTIAYCQIHNDKLAIDENGISKRNYDQTFTYTGSPQTITLNPGSYTIEAWGAQGGNYYGGTAGGGMGGYSSGVLNISQPTTIILNVGGSPRDVIGGFNGGGNGSVSDSSKVYQSAGGGASDVRLGGDTLDDRILVAGGGGGSALYYIDMPGGYGGGTTAGTAYYNNWGSNSISASLNPAANQTVPVGTNYDPNGPGDYAVSVITGTLGKGARGSGGGYYGGNSANTGNRIYSGGGGSGYVDDSVLLSGNTLGGNVSVPSYDGTSTMIGNAGDGVIRISGYERGFSGEAGSDELEKIEYFTPYTRDFAYTGEIESVTLEPGTYKLEVWGAQGGDSRHSSYSSYEGALGGYSSGEFTIVGTATLYIGVGGKGGLDDDLEGGFNGGGDGSGSNYANKGAGGGGATHIATVNGELSTLENNKNSVLIVAGGGGGSNTWQQSNYGAVKSTGVGGGSTGGDGTTAGTGASQSSGGAGYLTGTFGQGANGSGSGSGGGGGYYGGGSGSNNGQSGGGGSGYVGGVKNGITSDGNTTFVAPDGGTETGHAEDGYARITKVNVNNLPNHPSVPSYTRDFAYTSEIESVTLEPGTYKLEVWGAQGGDIDESYLNYGGKGGYSSGILTLTTPETLYVVVGGYDGLYTANANRSGGYNGGGSSSHGSPGGGATHIAYSSGLLTTFSNNYTNQVLLVAGGGGGTDYHSSTIYGGDGGGSAGMPDSEGSVANQSSGYQFGQGASGQFGGGGGGLWGGHTGSSNGDWAGGGSGYVNTAYITGQTIAGNTSFPAPTGGNETGHSGNGYARITKISTNNNTSATYYSKELGYTGQIETITLNPGEYTIEAWGASGGDGKSKAGGLGGYSAGTLILDRTTTFYIGVGGQGSSNTANEAVEGGFNGGGDVIASTKNSYVRGSGGGATHIATAPGELSTLENNKDSILLVAAGGGGAGTSEAGGAGGGTLGINGAGTAINTASGVYGGGGSQSSGGKYSTSGQTSANGTDGSFGQGGTGAGSNSYAPGGSGGGGYYGGGGGNSGSPNSSGGGGGGSGYINTAYITGQTIAGNASFPSVGGTSETGHMGDGYLRITGYEYGSSMYEVCDTRTEIPYNKTFNYTGQIETVTLNPGTYTIKAWGAQGVDYNTTYVGGLGGYSAGELTITETTTLYIGVGGQGQTFNGGHATSGNYHYGSGGATHIATATGELSTLENNKNSILLVAGGGGGATINGNGGYGGGANENGETGYGGYSNRKPGAGGTLDAGGAAGYGNYGSAGTFGMGGTNTTGSGSGGSMGGGGYYGGGAGGNDYSNHNDNDDGSGGGGSGYANATKLDNVVGSNGSNLGNGKIIITGTQTREPDKCSGYNTTLIKEVRGVYDYTCDIGYQETEEDNTSCERRADITCDNGYAWDSTYKACRKTIKPVGCTSGGQLFGSKTGTSCSPYYGIDTAPSGSNLATAKCLYRVDVTPSIIGQTQKRIKADDIQYGVSECKIDETTGLETCSVVEAKCKAVAGCEVVEDTCTATDGKTCEAKCHAEDVVYTYTLQWKHEGFETVNETFENVCEVEATVKQFEYESGSTEANTGWRCGYQTEAECPDGYINNGTYCVAETTPTAVPQVCPNGYTDMGTYCEKRIVKDLAVGSTTNSPDESTALTGDRLVVEVGQTYAFRNYIGFNPSSTRAWANKLGNLTSSVFFPQVVTNIWLFSADIAETGCDRVGGVEGCTLTASDLAMQLPITLTQTKIVGGNNPYLNGAATPYDAVPDDKDGDGYGLAQYTIDYLQKYPNTKSSTFPQQGYNIDGRITIDSYLANHLFAYFDNDTTYGTQNGTDIFANRYSLVEFVFKIEEDGLYVLNRNFDGSLPSDKYAAISEIEWPEKPTISFSDIYDRFSPEQQAYFFEATGELTEDGKPKYILKTQNETGEATINSIAFVSSVESMSAVDISNVRALEAVYHDAVGIQEMNDQIALSMMVDNRNPNDDNSGLVAGFRAPVGDVYINRLVILDDEGNNVKVYDAMTEDHCTNYTPNAFTESFNDLTYEELDALDAADRRHCTIDMNPVTGDVPKITLSKIHNYEVYIYTKYVDKKDDKADPGVNEHHLEILHVTDSGSLNVAKYLTTDGAYSDLMFISSGKTDRTNIISGESARFDYQMGWIPGSTEKYPVSRELKYMTVTTLQEDITKDESKLFANNANPLIIPIYALDGVTDNGEEESEKNPLAKKVVDGVTYVRVFYHDITAAGPFASKESAKLSYLTDKFSILKIMHEYKAPGDKFQFMLYYPKAPAGQQTQIWKQTNNPLYETAKGGNASSAGFVRSYAAGYEAVKLDSTGNYWGGLGLSETANTLLDGSWGQGWYWYAVGSVNNYPAGTDTQPGIAESDKINDGGGSLVNKVELWMAADVSKVDAFNDSLAIYGELKGITGGSYSAEIGTKSNAINSEKDWNIVTFAYDTGPLPDNKIEIIVKCMRNDGSYEQITERPNGNCLYIDSEVYTKGGTNGSGTCNIYAVVSRKNPDGVDTTTNIKWANENFAMDNWDYKARSDGNGTNILNIGDKQEILLETINIKDVPERHYIAEHLPAFNNFSADSFIGDNIDEECIQVDKVNYSITDLFVSPSKIPVDDNLESQEVTITGSYVVNRDYDKKTLDNRDVNVTFEVRNPVDITKTYQCSTTSEACDYGGITSAAYDKVNVKLDPGYVKNCYTLKCTLNPKDFLTGENIQVVAKINGGKTGAHVFVEETYDDNEIVESTVISKPPTPKRCVKDNVVQENYWDILFDFVYKYDTQIKEYNTGETVHMGWTDYEVGGTDVTDANEDAENDKIVYTAPVGGLNATTNGQGNELRMPDDYLAYKEHSTAYTALCTDYRNNPDGCWRYEMNAYHTVVYYNASTAITKLYTTVKTLPYTDNPTSYGKLCDSSKRTDFGDVSSGVLNVLGGNSGGENIYYEEYTGEDRSVETCHGYNQATDTMDGESCTTVKDWWNNDICKEEERQFSSLAYGTDASGISAHPSDYIPYDNFGTQAGGETSTASDTLGNTGIGYTINDSSEATFTNKSQTTKTNKIVLQNTNTQGEENDEWAVVRTMDVCTAMATTGVTYGCETYFKYGTSDGTATFEGDTTDEYGVCEAADKEDASRSCSWTSDELSPPDEVWWNDPDDDNVINGATCYRHHADFACGSYHSFTVASSRIDNEENIITGTCSWTETSSVQSGSFSRTTWSNSCHTYDNCTGSINCGSTCVATDGYGNCTATAYTSHCHTSACDKYYDGTKCSWTNEWSDGYTEGDSSSSACGTCDSSNDSRTVTETMTANGTASPTHSSGGDDHQGGTHMSLSCGTGDTQIGYYCYETYNDADSLEKSEDERCVRWREITYQEIKYLSTDSPTEEFISRTFEQEEANLWQWKCNATTGNGYTYPDQYVIKTYHEEFLGSVFIQTEKTNGRWVNMEDIKDAEDKNDYMPRSGEYFGVKAQTIYRTDRNSQPSEMPYLSRYYNNYHNITSNTNEFVKSPAAYKHFNYNDSLFYDVIATPNHGYCNVRTAEPYGCSTHYVNQYSEANKNEAPNLINVNGYEFMYPAGTQGQNGMSDHTAVQGNMQNNTWISENAGLQGVCYRGPDAPVWGTPENQFTVEIVNEQIDANGNIIKNADGTPATVSEPQTLNGKLFGTEGDISAYIRIINGSKSDDIVYRTMKGVGKCNATFGVLCTEYVIDWTLVPVPSDIGMTEKVWLSQTASWDSMTLEFSTSEFYGVAKYEQLLLDISGGSAGNDGKVWGNNTAGSFTEDGRFFNLHNNEEIKALCQWKEYTIESGGEVGWGTTEWEVT